MTDLLYILFIAFGLAADCFAVSVSGNIMMQHITPLKIARTAVAFGFCQAVMPVIGWLIGRNLVTIVADYDHWVAFVLLLFVGGKMIWESFKPNENNRTIDITSGLTLITLAVATSIDALVVGLSFAFLKINISIAAVTIGLVACIITILGFMLGKRLGGLIGKRAEAIGGIVLIGIGVKILLSHIL
jgi:putative Mn2+ efflux pump MntP